MKYESFQTIPLIIEMPSVQVSPVDSVFSCAHLQYQVPVLRLGGVGYVWNKKSLSPAYSNQVQWYGSVHVHPESARLDFVVDVIEQELKRLDRGWIYPKGFVRRSGIEVELVYRVDSWPEEFILGLCHDLVGKAHITEALRRCRPVNNDPLKFRL